MTDLLGNPISVGDTVVSFNHIYVVIELRGTSYVRAKLAKPSETTRPKNIYNKFVVVVTKLLKTGE